MQPWKMFIRSVSVVTVLTAGGFAAGQSVVPFMHTSRTSMPQVSEGDGTAPDAEVPAVDPAAEESTDDTTTTTTEAPKADAPDPVNDPAPAPAVDTPDESTTTTTPTTSSP